MSYYRNVDISSLALEHLNELFRKPKGRLGLLIKQQTLHAKDSEQFQKYANFAAIKFWDFGHRQLFANKASLTAVAWVRTDQKAKIIQKFERRESLAKEGKSLSEYGAFYQGFQSSADPIYKEYAGAYPKDELVRPVYPTSTASGHLYLPRLSRKIAFIASGTKAPEHFVEQLSSSQKKKLKSRAQVADSYPYSWRGTEGFDQYRFDDNQMRIVFARNFTKGNNMLAMLDKSGAGIGLTSHTVFIPKETASEDTLYAILGWLNSSLIIPELDRVNATKLASGGYGVYPNKMAEVRIPSELLTPSFAKFVSGLHDQRIADMSTLDKKIIELCQGLNTSSKKAKGS